MEPYFGDLTATDVIYDLVQIPYSERDENWQNSFLQNASKASFRCGDHQVITGPDGFPYFHLLLPEPNISFECYVIERMKDDFLLTSGFGVVINPMSASPDWVFTYGDILNFHLNKTFYTTGDTFFIKEKADEIIYENEEVIIGQPSENILPTQARKVIAEFLKMNGVANPKICLMMRRRKDEGVSQEIVFNLTPEKFNNENLYRRVMQTLGWYLPRHYSFVGMEDEIEGFMPL